MIKSARAYRAGRCRGHRPAPTRLPLDCYVAPPGLAARPAGRRCVATARPRRTAAGDPGRLDQIRPQPLTGLAERLTTARRNAAQTAGDHLRQAAIAAFAAVGLLGAATGITWFAPTSSARPNRVCVVINGKPAAELSTPITVHSAAAGTAIGPCP